MLRNHPSHLVIFVWILFLSTLLNSQAEAAKISKQTDSYLLEVEKFPNQIKIQVMKKISISEFKKFKIILFEQEIPSQIGLEFTSIEKVFAIFEDEEFYQVGGDGSFVEIYFYVLKNKGPQVERKSKRIDLQEIKVLNSQGDLKSELMEFLRTETEGIKKQNAGLKTEIQNLKGQIKKLQGVNDKLGQIQKNQEQLKERFSKFKYSLLQKQVWDLRSDFIEKTGKITKNITLINRQISKVNEDIAGLRQNNNAISNTKDNDCSCKDAEQQIKAIEESISDLKKEIDQENRGIKKTFDGQISQINTQISQIKVSINQKNQLTRQTVNVEETIQKQNNKLESQLLAVIKKNKENCTEEIADVRDNLNSINTTVRTNTKDISQIKRNLNQQKNKIDGLEQSFNTNKENIQNNAQKIKQNSQALSFTGGGVRVINADRDQQCSNGQIWDPLTFSCTCALGDNWVNGNCVPASSSGFSSRCQGGQIWNSFIGQCMCLPQYLWNGKQCILQN